jgi:FeS assembly SUF system regulator
MLRITRLSDYAVAILGQLAHSESAVNTAKELAARTGLPQPAVSKILKNLARSKLVASHRGVQGGYRLAREPSLVSVADVIEAVEGPVALTECGDSTDASCEFVGHCSVQANWIRINQVVRRALSNVSVEDMILPPRAERLIQLRRTSKSAAPRTRSEIVPGQGSQSSNTR